MKTVLCIPVLLALCSSIAAAGVPDPTFCTVTPIYGGPDPATEAVLVAPTPYVGAFYTVHVRNSAGVPIPSAVVRFLFDSQIQLCGSPVPNQIQAITDASGIAHLYLTGGGCLTNSDGACRVLANDIEIRTIRGVRSMDNGDHSASRPDLAVDLVDLMAFGAEFTGIHPTPPFCHDYNMDGLCNGVDLSMFATAFVDSFACAPAPEPSPGPNAGGVLVVHDTGVAFSSDTGIPPPTTPPADCYSVDNEAPYEPPTGYLGRIWKVYAVFPSTSSPRLAGVSWGEGLSANGDGYVRVLSAGLPHPLSDFEITHGDWRSTDGASIGQSFPTGAKLTTITEIYWFAGYGYPGAGPHPQTFCVKPHATQASVFVDDAIPAHRDPVAGWGCLGFGQPGNTPCPGVQAACCAPSTGACTLRAEIDCAAPSVWHGEWQSCDPNPCPEPGSCCYDDGTCAMMIQAGCAGFWKLRAVCDEDPCPPRAACCDPATGGCEVKFQELCKAPKVWHPEWPLCAPNPCPQPPKRACCATDGSCTITPAALCAWPSIWRSSVTTCQPNPCPQPWGACCFPDGSCLECSEEDAIQFGGQWKGAGVHCNYPKPCFVPDGIRVVVPLKVNIVRGTTITDAQIREVVTAANDILKNAGTGVHLFFDPKRVNPDFNEGDGDNRISAREWEALKPPCLEELAKKRTDGGMDGKGWKVLLTGAVPSNEPGSAANGITAPGGPAAPVSALKYPNPPVGAIARTMAHECGHVLGLLDLYSEWDIHNLMYYGSTYWDGANILTDEQREDVTVNAPKVGYERKKSPPHLLAYAGTGTDKVLDRMNVRNSLWTDSLGDAMHEYVDLVSGRLFAYDPPFYLDIGINLAGFLPDSVDSLDYEIGLDTDGQLNTGGTWGPYQGIDKVIRVQLRGDYPFTTPAGTITSTLYDLALGTEESLLSATLRREVEVPMLEGPDPPTAADSVEVNDSVHQFVGIGQLGPTAAVVPYALRARSWEGGAIDEVDETTRKELWWTPPAGPEMLLSPEVGESGTLVTLTGAGFASASPIEVRLDDSLLVTTAANDSGEVTVAFPIPSVSADEHFVTARDTTSAFDFSILTVADNSGVDEGEGSSVPPLELKVRPNPFRQGVELLLPGSGPGSIEIWDVAGRLVWRHEVPAVGTASRRVAWDGRDRHGRDAASGVYTARVVRGPVRTAALILKVR